MKPIRGTITGYYMTTVPEQDDDSYLVYDTVTEEYLGFVENLQDTVWEIR